MNEAITYLRQLLITRQGLLITAEAYASAVMDVFPLTPVSQFAMPKKYSEICQQALSVIQAEYPDFNITTDFSSNELADSSIAYHRVFGFITSSSRYYFSSKQLEKDLIAAEANPAISCHFFHINSGGGEAWYLDRLSETISSLKKPTVTLFEMVGGSAAYYIGCQAKHVFCLTDHDLIGCIGTMIDFYDWDSYFEKLGLKRITVRASKSDLKNKDYDDLRKGKTDNYINKFLDPLNEPFLQTVRTCRKKLKDAPDDEPALRGDMLISPVAIEKGLVDGKKSLLETLQYAKELAAKWDTQVSTRKKALNIFNS